MASKNIRLDFQGTSDVRQILNDKFRKAVNDIFNEEAKVAASRLEALSPVGASKAFGRPDLASGWSVKAARRSSTGFDVNVALSNKVPDAYERVFGSPAGTVVNVQDLERWVSVVDKVPLGSRRVRRKAYFVRNKIEREGTDRYQSGVEVLGFDRELKANPGSPVDVMEKRITSKLQALKLGFDQD